MNTGNGTVLPQAFLDRMKGLLGDEYAEFLKSYDDNRVYGLRVNTLKISVNDFLSLCPFVLERVPWASEGFYYSDEDRPGKHPYHEAGLYYIQEPSAMAAAELLDPKPGEMVMDLCAAPGGKTTHIASKMMQQGLLLANEIHPERSGILSQNIERMGIKNTVVTNETPDRLAQKFSAFFDRILVDAPCSGEGMFRKEPNACTEWSLENVAMCAERQLDILVQAGKMLKPGGRLVYSTCTFAPSEDEGVISRFLELNKEFEIESVDRYKAFSKGRPEWASMDANGLNSSLSETIRIWPHKVKGEGHYIAVLRKDMAKEISFADMDINDSGARGITAIKKRNPRQHDKVLPDSAILKDFFMFAEDNLRETPKGNYILFGEQLYLLPEGMPSLSGIKVVRPGWHLGTIRKNRFEPSHALALSLKASQAKYSICFDSNSKEIISYLRGESIPASGQKGWYLAEVDGYSIGWGKLSEGMLKNHYPKGLRW